MQQLRESDAERAQERAVELARRRLELAGSSRILLRLGDVRLYDDRVVTPAGECALSPRVRASVETARSLRRRRLRRVLHRPAPAPDRVGDADELFLLVETPSCTSVSAVPARNRRAVWHFAAQIVKAAQEGENVANRRRRAVQRLQQELDRIAAEG